MLKEKKVYISFDFGTKRIGVAVGQSLTRSATPLPALKARDGVPDWDQIATLIKEWQPQAFIVGIPLNMDGTEQQISFAARRFAHRLKERFKLTVYDVDERLSTVSARSKLFEHGGYKALKKYSIDSIAAKIILEDWLAQQII